MYVCVRHASTGNEIISLRYARQGRERTSEVAENVRSVAMDVTEEALGALVVRLWHVHDRVVGAWPFLHD